MIKIYTDGSCTPNPGKGTCAFIAIGSVQNVELHRDVQIYEQTTNNRMELQAVINAVDWFYQIHHDKGRDSFKIITDSQYVKNGITEWIKKWKVNGWKTASKKPVENKELWQDLDKIIGWLDTPLEWEWTKGHADDEWNNKVDKLCASGYKTQTEKSLEAVDRAFKELGKDGIQKILDQVTGTNIEGPTVAEYFELRVKFSEVIEIAVDYAAYVANEYSPDEPINEDKFKEWYEEIYSRK